MKAFLSVLILLSLLLPAICYAEWEYITHGGYDAAVGAWTRTALIFSDSNYKGLFISAIVLGAIAIFVATYVRAATGAKAGGLSWATPVLAGMAIYVAFIAPKDKLIIYDELLNRGPQEVGGIPLILATSAGILNKIEKGFTDIISTSTDPASDYRMNAGGTGWSLLDAVTPASVLPPNPYSTVQRFIKDCVYPELIRDGTVLDINKIARGEQKYDVVITESANPALYTVVYTDNGAGTTKTCYDAAPDVALILGNPTYGDLALKTICASKGFNTSGPSLNVCKNLIDSILTTTFPGSTGGNISFGVFLAQKVLADAFMQVAEQSSPSVAITTLATSQTQSQFIGLGLHANTWIPVLKESLTAVAISITPLLLLFAATPLASRALSLVFGMFVWLTMWGIIDAVIHAFGVDLAKQASQTIQAVSGDMGFTAMLMWPSYTAKVAATFGALRWSGLMLASVISGMLVKFGSTALAMLAGSISSMPQSSGAAYGGTGLRNMGGVVNSEIMPTQTWANASIVAGGVNNLTRGLVQKQAGEMAGGARAGLSLGMSKFALATETSESMRVGGAIGNYDKAMRFGISPYDLGYGGSYSGANYDARGVISRTEGKYIKSPDGKWKMTDVNLGLVSAKLSHDKTESYSKLHSLMSEALKGKSLDEIYKFYQQHKNEFSDYERGQIEGLLRKTPISVARELGGSAGHRGDISGDAVTKISGSTSIPALDIPAREDGSSSRGKGMPRYEKHNIPIESSISTSEQKRYSEYGDSYERDTIKNEIARILTDSYVRGQSRTSTDSSGNEWAKNLLDSQKYQEASKLAQEYKQSESISQAFSVGLMPLIVNKLAEEKGGVFDPITGRDDYFEAYQEIIQRIYNKDYSFLRKYIDDVSREQNISLPKEKDITKLQVENSLDEIKQNISSEEPIMAQAKTINTPKRPIKYGQQGKQTVNLNKRFDNIVYEELSKKKSIGEPVARSVIK